MEKQSLALKKIMVRCMQRRKGLLVVYEFNGGALNSQSVLRKLIAIAKKSLKGDLSNVMLPFPRGWSCF